MPKKKWNRLMRDAVKRYQKHHLEQFRGQPRSWSQPRGWGDWCPVCDYFFEAERCMSTGLHPAGCAEAKEDSEEIHRIGEKVAKFTLVCGGGAVMGAGLGRSPLGAIFGGFLICGWGKAAENAYAANCHSPRSGFMAVREPVC